jgi:polyisoprenoid-binding protein YceI
MNIRTSLTASLAGLTLFAVGSAVADDHVPASGTYQIDNSHTFAFFELSHLGLSNFKGRFDDIEGTVDFHPEKGEGRVEVVIDAASVNTGVADLDEHLRNEDFFHVEKYPEIRFVGDEFEISNGEVLAVSGDLTLLGVTRPVTLQFSEFNCIEHPMARVPACGGNAHTRIKRSDFGMDAYIPAVGDMVRLSIEVEALQPKKDEKQS